MEFQLHISNDVLPIEFTNVIITEHNSHSKNHIQIRSNVSNDREIKSWILAFENKSKTKWVVSRTIPEGIRMVCKRIYACQHSAVNKAPIIEKNKNKKGISKSTKCPAKITFKIKLSTRYTKKRDKYVKKGLPCVIEIQNCHNHPLDSNDVLKYLRSDAEVKDKFLHYFESGMGVADSKKHHCELMEMMQCTAQEFADGSINPTHRTISYWYEKWRKERYESKFDDNIFEVIVCLSFDNE